MNQIKFKAWDNDKKEMTKVVAMDWAIDGSISTCHLEYEDSSVEKKYPNRDYGDDIVFLRYTGLKDKKHKEVYDSYVYINHDNDCKGILTYYEYGLWTTEYKDGLIYNNRPFRDLDTTNFEVIGNKYENPELLNQKKGY